MISRYSFPKSMRLRTRQQYQRMMSRTLRYTGQWILVDIRGTTSPVSRLGITVTKRYGPAHRRNRFKRLVREAFRLSSPTLTLPVDILVRPRSDIHKAKRHDIQKELVDFINKAFQHISFDR